VVPVSAIAVLPERLIWEYAYRVLLLPSDPLTYFFPIDCCRSRSKHPEALRVIDWCVLDAVNVVSSWMDQEKLLFLLASVNASLGCVDHAE
jgi:hypothetical protein